MTFDEIIAGHPKQLRRRKWMGDLYLEARPDGTFRMMTQSPEGYVEEVVETGGILEIFKDVSTVREALDAPGLDDWEVTTS